MTQPLPLDSPLLPAEGDVRRAAGVLKKQAGALAALAKALDPPQPARLERALAALGKAGSAEVGAVESACRDWLIAEKDGRARRLSTELRDACAAAQIELSVLTRDPLELRLPPVSVRVDADADKAEVTFGRQVLVTCGAQAAAIIDARRKAMAMLEAGEWRAAAFHAQLLQAWKRVGGDGWAELTDVHAELAWLRQPARFRLEPVASNLAPYPRALFLYDLWRLRRDRCLSVGGWRLGLGPATGGSVRDKKRVMWVEDDHGQGQWHLTLRFVLEADSGRGGDDA